jgi:hypothetical protein
MEPLFQTVLQSWTGSAILRRISPAAPGKPLCVVFQAERFRLQRRFDQPFDPGEEDRGEHPGFDDVCEHRNGDRHLVGGLQAMRGE